MFRAIASAKKFRNRRRSSDSHAAGRDVFHRRLLCEPLEDRHLLSVALNWGGGPGNPLILTELTPGTTRVPTITISEPSPGTNLLKVDVGPGNVFDSSSDGPEPGLTYENGQPTNSEYALVDISQVGNVAGLQAVLPGDNLVIGPIDDAVGGIGSDNGASGGYLGSEAVNAFAANIEVAGINTVAANTVGYSGPAASTAPGFGGSVQLWASGNLTVESGAVVNTGWGMLALAADVNQDGSGNDGLGTLSIARRRRGDIGKSRLRIRVPNPGPGARPDLSGGRRDFAPRGDRQYRGRQQSGPGPRPRGFALPTPAATIDGTSFDGSSLNVPFGQNAATTSTLTAFDPSGDLYVAAFDADGNQLINEYGQGSSVPGVTLSGFTELMALACDANGDLFVDDSGNVMEFAAGQPDTLGVLERDLQCRGSDLRFQRRPLCRRSGQWCGGRVCPGEHGSHQYLLRPGQPGGHGLRRQRRPLRGRRRLPAATARPLSSSPPAATPPPPPLPDRLITRLPWHATRSATCMCSTAPTPVPSPAPTGPA